MHPQDYLASYKGSPTLYIFQFSTSYTNVKDFYLSISSINTILCCFDPWAIIFLNLSHLYDVSISFLDAFKIPDF